MVVRYGLVAQPRGKSALAAVLVLILVGCSSGGSEGASGAAPRAQRVQVVNQNLLHGNACPPNSDHCRRPDRVRLFATQIGRTCPDLVAIEEGSEAMVALLRSAVARICRGRYRVVWDGDPGLDREIVLTTARVLGVRRFRLAGPLRTTLWVRVAADVGVVDLWATHLASGSDDRPCDRETCKPPCRAADSIGTCQARQVVDLARKHRASEGLTVLAGDLNAKVGGPTIGAIEAAGFVDSHIAAGNPECAPETGKSCTSGRDDSTVDGLSDSSARQKARLDYIFLGPNRRCSTSKPTGLYAAAPETDGPGGLAFPSDHSAVVATVDCPTTTRQQTEATKATLAPTTTSTVESSRPDDNVATEIGAAFDAVFGGSAPDVASRVANIEDGASVQAVVAEGYERNKAVADRIAVRIDTVHVLSADEAEVTFTLLLDGGAVLDNLPGKAVRIDGRWLVSKRTFCNVGTTGMTSLPASCR